MSKNKRTICGFCGREFERIPEDFFPSGFEGMGICSTCLKAGHAALQAHTGNKGKRKRRTTTIDSPPFCSYSYLIAYSTFVK